MRSLAAGAFTSASNACKILEIEQQVFQRSALLGAWMHDMPYAKSPLGLLNDPSHDTCTTIRRVVPMRISCLVLLVLISCHGVSENVIFPTPSSGINAQAAGVTPDEFSYMMALKACSAGLWSGNSWDEIDGCGTQDRDTSAVAQPLDILGYMGESPGANIPPCRGRHALEVKEGPPTLMLRPVICRT